MDYHEIIKQAVERLCIELNIKTNMQQNFLELTYESGLDHEVSFKSRIEMAVYIEFIKAGIINESNCDY